MTQRDEHLVGAGSTDPNGALTDLGMWDHWLMRMAASAGPGPQGALLLPPAAAPTTHAPGALLTSRRHIDLLRVVCAAC